MPKFYRTILSLSLFPLIFLSYFFNFSQILLTILLLTNINLIYTFRFNLVLFIFSIFISFYSIALIPYFIFNLEISFFETFNDKNSYLDALMVHVLFLNSFLLLIPSNNFVTNRIDPFVLSYKRNNFLFYFFYMILIFILIFGIQGLNIFESGQYASDLVNKSTFYEYFILFFLLSYYYSTRTNFHLFLLTVIYFTYCIKTLLFGGRIEIVQISLLFFIIHFSKDKKNFSQLKVLLFMFIFYYFNIVVSNIRNNPNFLVTLDLGSIINPFVYLNSQSGVVQSNEGEVFQSSARLIAMVRTEVIGGWDRLLSLTLFPISFFAPSSYLSPLASLISYKQDEITSGGGGLISSYFFVWFSWLGPIILSFIIIIILTSIFKAKNDSLKLYGIMFLSTFPRWFSYNPIIIFKLCFLVIPITFTLNMLLKKSNK